MMLVRLMDPQLEMQISQNNWNTKQQPQLIRSGVFSNQ